MQPFLLTLSALFFCVILTSCSAFLNSSQTKTAMCNKLKSDIIFNGATPIQRDSVIQQAQMPLQQQTYDKNC